MLMETLKGAGSNEEIPYATKGIPYAYKGIPCTAPFWNLRPVIGPRKRSLLIVADFPDQNGVDPSILARWNADSGSLLASS